MKYVLGTVSAIFLASTPVWAVYHGWSGKGQAGRLDDIANWGISSTKFVSDDFHVPSKTVSGSENQCGGLVDGTYTISADTYMNRFVMDKANQTAVNLDLGPYTMFLVGLNGYALGGTANGSGSTWTVTSGTLCVPLEHNGVMTGGAWSSAGLPPNADGSGMHDASLLAKGASAILDLKVAKLNWGTNNCIGAVDGGVFKSYSREMNVTSESKGNRWYFSRGGKLKNPYDNPNHDQLCCDFAFGGVADGHRYEFADGGTLEGYERFTISGGTGFEVRFAGPDTDVIFNTTNTKSVLLMTGTRNLLNVTDGAKLRVTNSLNKSGRARIWLNGDGNVVRASGKGSLIQFYNAGNLIGQFASANHLIHATNYGEIRMAGLHLGQGGDGSKRIPAVNNKLLVDNHGIFRDWENLIVGNGADFTCCSNRMDVMNGGKVYVNCLYVGRETNGVDNVVDIGAEGTVNLADDLMLGYFGHRNLVEIHDGGRLNVAKNFFFGYRGGSTNRVVVRDCARMTVGGLFAIGTQDQEGDTFGNALEIKSGAEVEVANFVVYCSNNCVKVENAWLTAVGADTKAVGIHIPWYNERDGDAHLILSGTNPVVRSMSSRASATANYAMGIRRGAKVTFVVPKGGYAEPPLQTPNGRIGFFDDGKGNVPDICFDLSELVAYHTEVVLARSKELYISPLALNRMQENLRAAVDACFGQSCPCRVTKNNNELRITIGAKGLFLIVR